MISRMTVRQAMNKLINEGYIERRRGKGTIVLEKENKVETILKSSFNGVLEKKWYKESSGFKCWNGKCWSRNCRFF